jgi:hypothetical protein
MERTNRANAERGEVDLEIKNGDGEVERSYVLKLSMNAAVALQRKHKKSMAQIFSEVERLDFEAMREIAFMLLQKHHSGDVKTPEQAGDIIDDAGGPDRFFGVYKALIEANVPRDAEGKPASNPPTAQTMTSGGSISTLDAPA